MNYVVIKPPPYINNIEEYVIESIKKALAKPQDFVVLDLGSDFVYNSRILSTALVNRSRIVIISPNEKFKTMLQILKMDQLVCVLETFDEFIEKCSKSCTGQCSKCYKAISIDKGDLK